MTDTQNCPLCFNSTTTDSAVEEYNRQVRRDENKHLLAQIEALKEKYAALESRCYDGGGSQSVFDAVKELRSELAAAKRDGERYQWLEDGFVWDGEVGVWYISFSVANGKVSLAEHIDAAIEQGGRGNG